MKFAIKAKPRKTTKPDDIIDRDKPATISDEVLKTMTEQDLADLTPNNE